MNIRRRLVTALLLLVGITALSVLGYRLLGGRSVGFLQALYMAVITLAGVGYSEVVDTSQNVGLLMRLTRPRVARVRYSDPVCWSNPGRMPGSVQPRR